MTLEDEPLRSETFLKRGGQLLIAPERMKHWDQSRKDT